MKRAISWLDKHAEEVLMCLFLSGIVVFMSVHVFCRYVLKAPLVWTEELTRFCFIWFVLSGMSYGIKNGTHIRVNIIETFFPKIVPVFSLIQDLIFLAFILYLIPAGIDSMNYYLTKSQPSPGLHMPLIFLYGYLLVALFASLIRMAQKFYFRFAKRKEAKE